jgi:hypothetical protein
MTKRTLDLLEEIRERAENATGPYEPLEFFTAARELGLSVDEANDADEDLTVRVLRAAGAL